METRNYIIYMHQNMINGKVYIGQTCRNPEVRWNNGEGYIHNDHFYKAIKYYGWENFAHIILYEQLTKDEANQLEIALIKYYDATNPQKGYNNAIGGASNRLYETVNEVKAARKRTLHKAYKKMVANEDYAQQMRDKSLQNYYNNKNNKKYMQARSISNHNSRQHVYELRCKLRELYSISPEMFSEEDYIMAFGFAKNNKSYICNSIKKLEQLFNRLSGGINEETKSEN